MRKPVILTLVWGLTSLFPVLSAQTHVDLGASINPGSLDPAVLAAQIDTSNQYRHTVALFHLQPEFPSASEIFVETYYQRSDDHMLLEMSKANIPLKRTFLVSEGLGSTFWKISDDACWVVLLQQSAHTEHRLELVDRGCVE